MRLAQESILMQFGYTVSQESLSASRRQKILAVMIDNKVLSKSEIMLFGFLLVNDIIRVNSIELISQNGKWIENLFGISSRRIYA